MLTTIFDRKHDKGARNTLCAPLINRPEFCCVPQPEGPWKRFFCGQNTLETLIVLNYYSLATLVTPCFEHEPAATGFHPLTKPVSFCAPAVIRLICSLWHFPALLQTVKSSIPTPKKAALSPLSGPWSTIERTFAGLFLELKYERFLPNFACWQITFSRSHMH